MSEIGKELFKSVYNGDPTQFKQDFQNAVRKYSLDGIEDIKKEQDMERMGDQYVEENDTDPDIDVEDTDSEDTENDTEIVEPEKTAKLEFSNIFNDDENENGSEDSSDITDDDSSENDDPDKD